jgi:hypothetical protein
MASFWAIGKEDGWLLLFMRWCSQDGVMAAGIEEQNRFDAFSGVFKRQANPSGLNPHFLHYFRSEK